jgi:hypothetical protein
MQRPRLLTTGLLAALGGGAVLSSVSGWTQPSDASRFPGIDGCINGETGPGGRATLVNFWTYSCINSLRSIPYITAPRTPRRRSRRRPHTRGGNLPLHRRPASEPVRAGGQLGSEARGPRLRSTEGRLRLRYVAEEAGEPSTACSAR